MLLADRGLKHCMTYDQEIGFVDILTHKWIEINRQHLISGVKNTHLCRSVLDIGCGRWPYIASLTSRLSSGHFVALDISKENVASAKHRSPMGFHFIVADAQHMPLRQQAFDLTFSKDLIHHVEKPKQVLEEIARVSRRAILVEANRPNKANMMYTHLNRDQHLSLQALTSLVSETGLTILAVRQLHCYPGSFFFHLKHPIAGPVNLLSVMFMTLVWLIPREILRGVIRMLGLLLRTPSFNCLEISSDPQNRENLHIGS